jgi:hypothetical protein
VVDPVSTKEVVMPDTPTPDTGPAATQRPDVAVTPEQKAPGVLPLEAQVRALDLEIDGDIDAAEAPGAEDAGFLRKEAS